MADLEVTVAGGVATMTMNRPEARNALSMDMRAQMDDEFPRLEFDDSIRCIVLEGAGHGFRGEQGK